MAIYWLGSRLSWVEKDRKSKRGHKLGIMEMVEVKSQIFSFVFPKTDEREWTRAHMVGQLSPYITFAGIGIWSDHPWPLKFPMFYLRYLVRERTSKFFTAMHLVLSGLSQGKVLFCSSETPFCSFLPWGFCTHCFLCLELSLPDLSLTAARTPLAQLSLPQTGFTAPFFTSAPFLL